MISTKAQEAKVIAQSLPYIKKFAGARIVIKIGGSPIDDGETLANIAKDIVFLDSIGIKPIVVHGGGKQISKLLGQLNIDVHFDKGIRVTDPETMWVVNMVLAGEINAKLVNAINHAGGKAVGLSGRDAQTFTATSYHDDATGKSGKSGDRAGKVASIDSSFLTTLGNDGLIPVIAPVAVDMADGELRNINADWVACAIASQLPAQRLLLLSDVSGIYDENKKVISTLTRAEAADLVGQDFVSDGMISKINALVECLLEGVECAHIIDGRLEHAILLELLTDAGIGTILTQS